MACRPEPKSKLESEPWSTAWLGGGGEYDTKSIGRTPSFQLEHFSEVWGIAPIHDC